ncbi:DNA polymerase III subunit beta [Candidatus Parcubacteria bacterium]|nr:DNA polymerase III subunit beta [Candidatus Parcubacteria bacterium]
MKVECIIEKLSKNILQAERIAGRNHSLPVINCILLEATKNSLIIRSTNLDLGVEITMPVKVVTEGSVAIPAGILGSFLSSISDDKTVILSVEENNLTVSTQKNQTHIKTYPKEDFPTIPVVMSDKTFKINAGEFVRGLKSVWYSSAISSMKAELSSVYVYCNDDEDIVFVATDSFRLAEKKIQTKKAKEFGSLLIPFKNIPEIIRVLEEINGEVQVNLEKNQISFSYDGVYITSRVIDGIFPDYKQIIPKGNTTEVVMLKQDFINSLKIANIFSNKLNQINIKALPSKKVFELQTKNSDVGDNTNTIDAVFSGEDVDINFNYKYIVDCLQSIESDSVSLSFNGISKPLVIRGVSDKSFLYLVMPMNK